MSRHYLQCVWNNCFLLSQLVMFVWWVIHEMRWEQWSCITLTSAGLEYVLIQSKLTTGRETTKRQRLCVDNLAMTEEWHMWIRKY